MLQTISSDKQTLHKGGGHTYTVNMYSIYMFIYKQVIQTSGTPNGHSLDTPLMNCLYTNDIHKGFTQWSFGVAQFWINDNPHINPYYIHVLCIYVETDFGGTPLPGVLSWVYEYPKRVVWSPTNNPILQGTGI